MYGRLSECWRRMPLSVPAGVVLLCFAPPAFTQVSGGASALLEEVVVTARKRAEDQQDVPMSISAYGESQIQALKIRSLTDLAVAMPNVSLEDVGTARGIANFTIRGKGINTSVPSVDPTVGTFVDGVYLGSMQGAGFDMFDLESIQVLRGPQGVLFGRNVTGGAVLVKTKRPGDEFEALIRTAVDGGGDGGLNRYIMGAVGGPLSETFGARLYVYHNDDDGYHENLFDGSDFGAAKQTMIRPTLVWRPTEELDITLRYQYTEVEGDGPATQSHTNGAGVPGSPESFDRDSFDFSVDNGGEVDSKSNFLALQVDWQVGSNGTITNIFGYRDIEYYSFIDTDSQPLAVFTQNHDTESEQFSNELRYNGIFQDGRLNFTGGVFYYKNEITARLANRLLMLLNPTGDPLITQDGGGVQNAESYSAFASVDYDLTQSLVLTAGANYTYEEKDVEISPVASNTNAPCSTLDGTCPILFRDNDDWNAFSPKLGLTYLLNDRSRVYGVWSRGFRSGGYNLRPSAANSAGPFDQEQADSFELGYKAEFDRGRISAAVFYDTVLDQQRDALLILPGVGGVVQVIRNATDAEMLGFEVDGVFNLTERLVMTASVGWVDAEYTDVKLDLTGDGIIDDTDENLDLPRAHEWTYSIGLNHDLPIGTWGIMSSRVSYAYRDEAAFTDNNQGFLPEIHQVNAGLDFYSNDGHWAIGLYARNLLDEVSFGSDIPLPDALGPQPLGGTFAVINNKGRLFGAEVTYSF